MAPADLTRIAARALRHRKDATVGQFESAVGGPARARVILLLAGVLALDSADTSTVGAIGAPLERGLHIGNTQLGLLVTVTLLIGALGAIPAGVLVDRLRRSDLLVAGIALWSVATAVSALATSYEMLLLTRLAVGAIVAIAGPSVASLTGDFFPGSERARILGFIVAGELVGAAFGFVISGEVAGVLSWRSAFAVLAVPGFVLAYVVWRLLPEPARGGQSRLAPGALEIVDTDHVAPLPDVPDGDAAPARGDELTAQAVKREHIRPRRDAVLQRDPAQLSARQAVRYVLGVRTNVLLIVSSALGYFFFAGLKTFAVLYVRGQFGVGQSEATLLFGVIVIAAVAGTVLGGRIADRLIVGGRLSGRILVGGCSFILASAVLGPAIAVSSIAIALPFYCVGAAALTAPNPPLDAARLDIMPAALWGRAEGLRTTLRSVAESAAPLLFGVLSTQLAAPHRNAHASSGFGADASTLGLRYTFLIMLIPLLASGVIMLRARRSYPRDIATAIASEQHGARSVS